jgi:hypothetical protein
MKIYQTEKELQYEKLLNELYTKNIGLKNYSEIDSLIADWLKVESDYLEQTDPNISNRMEVLYKLKSLRFKENIKKLLKNLKQAEEANLKLKQDENGKIYQNLETTTNELKVKFLLFSE